MSPGPSALERNLARLFARAYQPVLPRESFRARLESDFLAALAPHPRARHLPRAPGGLRPALRPALRPWRLAAGLAAAAAVLLGAWWSLRPGGGGAGSGPRAW